MKPLSHTVPPEGAPSLQKSVTHRRVEITVEREVVSMVSEPGAGIAGWCDQCGRNVWMLSPEAAAKSKRISTREIYRWLGQKELHFEENESGAISLCSESLRMDPTGELL